MYCSQCGAKLPDNAKFCYKCGAKIEIPDWEEGQQDAVAEEPKQPAIQWPEIPGLAQPVQPVEKKAEPEFRWPDSGSSVHPVRETVTVPAEPVHETVTQQEPAPLPVPAEGPVTVTEETMPELEPEHAEDIITGQEQPVREETPQETVREFAQPVTGPEVQEYVHGPYAETFAGEEIPAEEEPRPAEEDRQPAEVYAAAEPETVPEAPEEPVRTYAETFYEEPAEEIPQEVPAYARPEETPVPEEGPAAAPEEAYPVSEPWKPEEERSEPAVITEEPEQPEEERPETAVIPEEPEQPEEERFEPVAIPEEPEQSEDEFSGFRIVEKAIHLSDGAYVFSHADDLARAASDALSQFSILTEQELSTPEVRPEEEPVTEPQQEETSAEEEAHSEEPVTEEIPEQIPETEEGPEPEPEEQLYVHGPYAENFAVEETVPEEEETLPVSEEMLPEGAYVTEEPEPSQEVTEEPVRAYAENVYEDTAEEVPQELPVIEQPEESEVSAETEPETAEVPEETELPAEGPQETPVEPVQEERPGETEIEDFIPSLLVREMEENVPEQPAEQQEILSTADDAAEQDGSGLPGEEKKDEVPISFEEFRFYTRREIEAEKAAYEQQRAEEENPVPEDTGEDHIGFSFERDQEPEKEEEIPELMYAAEGQEQFPEEEPTQQEDTVREPVEETPEEETAERTIFTQEEGSKTEETSAEGPAAEETPSSEPQAEPERAEKHHREEHRHSSSSKEKKSKKNKRSSKHKNAAADNEDEKKKQENRKRLISLLVFLAVLLAAVIGGWYWYNMPDNVYSRYMSGAIKAAEEGDVFTAAVDFNEALKVRPDSLQASEQLDRLYSEAYETAYDYMDKQMFAEAHEQAQLLATIHPEETENNTAALKEVFMAWAAASARTGVDQDIQHVLDMASSELSRENYADVENSARSAKAGYEFADFFMSSGDRLLELNSGNDRVSVFKLLDSMLPQIKEYADRSGSFPVRTGTDAQGREAAIYYDPDSLLQLYIGNFDSSGRRTGDAFSYIISIGTDGSREYGSYSAVWSGGEPNGSFDYHDLASNYSGTERGIARGTANSGYYDGTVSIMASDGYTYSVSFSSGTVKVVADTAPDGQKNVIGYAADGERWLCWSDAQVAERHGLPYCKD